METFETIRLHPTARPILVASPEQAEAITEAFNKAAEVIKKAFAVMKEVLQKMCKVMAKAFKAISKFTHYPTPVRLYPTASTIEVPFYKALELGYFRE